LALGYVSREYVHYYSLPEYSKVAVLKIVVETLEKVAISKTWKGTHAVHRWNQYASKT